MAHVKPIQHPITLISSSTSISAAEALLLIQGWDDLSPNRRCTLCSAIRVLPRVMNLPLEAIPMDPMTLNDALSGVSAAAMGVQQGSVASYVSAIRTVLRRLGKVRDRRNPILSPEWQELHDALHTHFEQMKVAGFFSFLSEHKVRPSEVTNAHVAKQRFVDWPTEPACALS